MRPLRLPLAAPLLTSLGALALTAFASAQFDGPAPLAWRWIQPTTAAPTGAPLVSGETIYTAVGGRIYAIDRATGNKKWQYPQVEPVNGLFRTTPVLVGDTLVAAADNKIVYAINPETGAPKWTYNSPSPVLGAPVTTGSYVAFATSDNTLIALDAATGKPAWAPYNIYDRLQGQIAAYNGGIVFFTGLNELRSLDIVSKRANYLRPVKFGQLSPRAQPVLFGDTFYVTSGPYLIAVNASSGVSKWQSPNLNMQIEYPPAVSAEGVFVVSTDGAALVLDPQRRGAPIEAMRKGPVQIGSFAAVRPTAVGTKFVIPTTNGAVNLFDPATGSLLWSYVVRPVGDVYETAGTSTGGAPGMPGGSPGGQSGTQGRRITSLLASGPAVLAGTTLLLPARDGSILAFDKELGVDLTPPDVKQLWPAQGDVVSGQPPLELIFRLQDEAAGVNETTVRVAIDDKPASFNYTRDGLVRISFSNLAGAQATTKPVRGASSDEPKSNPVLQDGRHSVTVTVADWLGNVSKTTYSVVIDNALPPSKLPGADTTGAPGGPGGGRGGRGGSGDGG